MKSIRTILALLACAVICFSAEAKNYVLKSDKVQLSNFCILEDCEAGTLEIYLSKLDQFSGKHKYDCETWKYTVYLPVDEKE